jgi:hypothetical protein
VCFRLFARPVIDQSLFADKDFRPWALHRSPCYTKLVLRNLVKTSVIKWPVLWSHGGSGGPRLTDVARGECHRSGAGLAPTSAGQEVMDRSAREEAHFWNAVRIEGNRPSTRLITKLVVRELSSEYT